MEEKESRMKIIGKPMVFGIMPRKPIINLPLDVKSVKVRMRPTNYAKAFVRSIDRIQLWTLRPSGGVINSETWELDILIAENWTLIPVNQQKAA